MQNRFAWGILGTGNIARQFCAQVMHARDSALVGVGSRTMASADQFGDAYNIPRRLGSYDELLACNEIEAVYISLPNNLHHEWTIKALRAGKHVLCEKPIATNATEAAEMFAVAAQQKRVLMEAFMYRCHPLIDDVVDKVRQGVIGQLKIIRTSFCFRVRKPDGNIRFSPELHGGALMDIGVYCINFSRLLAGTEPCHVNAMGTRHSGGVDESLSGQMQFANGILAQFGVSMSAQADNSAHLLGDEGFIRIPVPWKPPMRNAEYIVGGGTPTRMDQPKSGQTVGPPEPQVFYSHADQDLYANEADTFARCCREQAPLPVSADDSINNMRIVDQMRNQILTQWKSA